MRQHLTAASLALFISAPAWAASLTEFTPAIADAEACWQRTYDASHLAAHPDQQVTAMTFALGFLQFDEEDPGQHYFGVTASLRDGRQGEASGGCWADETGVVRCGVDCDGGGFAIRLDGEGNLLADLEPMGYIRLEGGCSGEAESQVFPLRAGLDDKLFLLHRTAEKLCEGLLPHW